MSVVRKAPAGVPNVIASFTDGYNWLSNFFPRPIVFMMDSKILDFPSSEHAYQAAKFRAAVNDKHVPEFIQSIINEPDPTKCKHLGRKMKIDPGYWDSIKDSAMRAVVYEKFRQHDDLQDKLLQTGAVMLVEGNTWKDTYWGRCEGQGYNRLGSILMEVRGYFYWKSLQALDKRILD